jgi:hypothetical protein
MIGIIIAAAVLFALFSAVTMRAIYWALSVRHKAEAEKKGKDLQDV